MVAAKDYGRVRWTHSGTPLGKVRDGYAPFFERRRLPATEVQLPEGAAIKLTVEGKNPESHGYFAGLDAVLLEPIP